MSVGENQVAFEVGGTLLVSKLIEGNYPNYRQVIPGEAKERVTLEREQFLNAVHRVSLLSSEKSNSVKLVFTKNNIEIAANTPDIGEARESLPVTYKGRDFHRVQSGVSHGAAAQSAQRRGLPRPDRRDEPGRDQDSDPVSLRADADAHQLEHFSFAVLK